MFTSYFLIKKRIQFKTNSFFYLFFDCFFFRNYFNIDGACFIRNRKNTFQSDLSCKNLEWNCSSSILVLPEEPFLHHIKAYCALMKSVIDVFQILPSCVFLFESIFRSLFWVEVEFFNDYLAIEFEGEVNNEFAFWCALLYLQGENEIKGF